MTIRRVLAAPDKFKGTATAHEVAEAIGHAVWDSDRDVVEIPLSDGGDGLLEVLGGANRTSTVVGPLGTPVAARWRMHRGVAVIEMAQASGLVLAGGAAGNDPLDATTEGVGQLIDQALDAGARRIIVGLGGSATTDGGYGAIRAINGIARLERVELLVACDVETRFVDAAAVYGPQKGATPAQVKMLTNRLERLVQLFADEFDADVADIAGGGAAGGLGGALAALGGRLLPGFELVADELDVYDHLDDSHLDDGDLDDSDIPDSRLADDGRDGESGPGRRVDLVVTGEGRLDPTSFSGKVVGGMIDLAAEAGVPVLVVAGSADPESVARCRSRTDADVDVIVLADRYGHERAMAQPKWCVTDSVGAWLAER